MPPASPPRQSQCQARSASVGRKRRRKRKRDSTAIRLASRSESSGNGRCLRWRWLLFVKGLGLFKKRVSWALQRVVFSSRGLFGLGKSCLSLQRVVCYLYKDEGIGMSGL